MTENQLTIVYEVCINYKRDTQGEPYDCSGFHSINGEKGCPNCYNWQNQDGVFQRQSERIRDGITDFQM